MSPMSATLIDVAPLATVTVVLPDHLTIRQACEALDGIARETLLAWCAKERITPQRATDLDLDCSAPHAPDGRHKLLTRGHVETLARRHNVTLRMPRDLPEHRETLPRLSRDTASTSRTPVAPRGARDPASVPAEPAEHMATLSARVESLERENHLLRSQLRQAREASAAALPVVEAAPLPPPKLAMLAIEPLPGGYAAVTTFFKDRRIDPRVIPRLIRDGLIPPPEEPPAGTVWRRRTRRGHGWMPQDIKHAYPPEAFDAVAAVLRQHFPEKYREPVEAGEEGSGADEEPLV